MLSSSASFAAPLAGAAASPLLFADDDGGCAAVFECGDDAAVLRSRDGRCIVVQLARAQVTPRPVASECLQLQAQGYRLQGPVSGDPADFAASFMTVAGFTVEHVEQALRLGPPAA